MSYAPALGREFAQLVEQPRILDGDDGLRSEVLHQFDLLVRERPDFLAVNGKCPDQLVIFEHRHINRRPRAAELHRRIVRCNFSSIVIRMAYLFCLFDTIKVGALFGSEWSASL